MMELLDAAPIFAAGFIAGSGIVGVGVHYFLTRKYKVKVKDTLDYDALKTRVILHEKELEALLERMMEINRILKNLQAKRV